MKNKLFLTFFILVFAVEIVALTVFALQTPDTSQETVAVNEVVQSVAADFHTLNTHQNKTALDYVVIDTEGNVLFRTRENLSESVNSAIAHRDTLLDIVTNGNIVGKVIIYNDGAQALHTQKRTAIIVLSVATAIECVICCVYGAYMHRTIVKPFTKLKGFAERVAGGNLDIPLEMDRQNLFGAFTESFDIMRSELKKARIAEAQANESKKELVAKLSHDIKTPVASIKAVAEVGLAVTANDRDRANYSQIIEKSDRINALVTNLFTATLEELQQLSVNPENTESAKIGTLLENADYLKKATLPELPECLVSADPLRLQQVFDNVFANSYKYAGTEIAVTAEKCGNFLNITIEDFGGGVDGSELPTLKEKYKRGSNAAHIEGAGLGLYISDYFMQKMRGNLEIKNGERGLQVTISLPLSGKRSANVPFDRVS